MSSQIVFEHAVKHHLPHAFISLLERIDEFQIGTVLTLHDKPHFWRKKELDFTSLPLEALITDDLKNDFKLQTEKNLLFSESDDQSNRVVDIDLDLDAELKVAWVHLGGKFGGDGKKVLTLSVKFGSVSHIVSNVFEVLSSKHYTVDVNHFVVKEALAKGGALFVISSIYESQKADIKISEKEQLKIGTDDEEAKQDTSDAKATEGDKKGTGETVKVAGESGAAKGDTGADTSGITVTNRDIPTNIAFHVLKVTVNKNGVLIPVEKSGFTHHHKIHLPYADTFFTPTEKQPSADGHDKDEAIGGGATPKESGKKDDEQKGKPEEKEPKPTEEAASEKKGSDDKKEE